MQQRQLYRSFLRSLEMIYDKGEALAITDLVFESMAGIKKSDIITNEKKELDSALINKLTEAMNELKTGKPVQYVLGAALFCGHSIFVAPGVLIPRPETEELVCHVLKEVKGKSGIKILDIGTGSGCIAISIQKAIPENEVHAIEKSTDALMIAKNNAEKLGARIDWHQFDFLGMRNADEFPMFDIIVSNPPYIPTNEKDSIEINVRAFEPEIALFVPDDSPLIFYEAIARFGKTNLSEQGIIWVEIHADFGIATQQIFESFDYEATLIQDGNGRDRFVRAINHSR